MLRTKIKAPYASALMFVYARINVPNYASVKGR